MDLVFCDMLAYMSAIEFWPDYIGRMRGTSATRSEISKIDEPGLLSRSPRGRTKLTKALKGNFMITGTVKFYNDQKGYGFIQPDSGGKDVFVHATALERSGMRSLKEGQKVSFDTQEDKRTGKVAVGTIKAA